MPTLTGTSTDRNTAAITGTNSAGGSAGAFQGTLNVSGGQVLALDGISALSPASDKPAVGAAHTAGGTGVQGSSSTSHGVHGANGSFGLTAAPKFGCGVWGESENGYGVYGSSKSSSGVYGTSGPGHLAGEFVGDVTVTGNVTVSGNVTATDVIIVGADCAEDFDVLDAGKLEPGTVVVFDGEGAISESAKPYNRCVAGVVSGAGKYRPGVVLGRVGFCGVGKAPVALMGRVYCKVDASYSPIELGDMLTTSSTPGFAMKATDPSMAFGAVIGKALASVTHGRGLIPILVTLQ